MLKLWDLEAPCLELYIQFYHQQNEGNDIIFPETTVHRLKENFNHFFIITTVVSTEMNPKANKYAADGEVQWCQGPLSNLLE